MVTKERQPAYNTPSKCKMIRITAITIRVWIQPPVRGNLGLIFRPKKPNSHRMMRITMIVHNMRFLLLYNQVKATRLVDRAAVFPSAGLIRANRRSDLTAY